MPRRHPKEDDKSTGPSAAVLAERRERRALKRSRKSPAQGLERGLLTSQERMIINLDLRDLQREDAVVTTDTEKQIGSLERELLFDNECRQRRSSPLA